MTRTWSADPTLASAEIELWRPELERRGWSPAGDGDWRLYLARALPPEGVFAALEPGRRVNRFPGIGAFALKPNLLANLRAALWATGREDLFGHHPETFLLPDERRRWESAARQEPGVWVVKRWASTRGRGMRLAAGPAEVADDATPRIVQRYLDPHLIDGRKYSLRFYLLLESLDPLRCHLHPVGTCRFASLPYSLDADGRAQPAAHFTNSEIQDRNGEQRWWSRDGDLELYRSLSTSFDFDVEATLETAQLAILGLVLACRDEALIRSRQATPHVEGCYDFLGIDVQVDTDGRPWILEANAGPPMELEPIGEAAALGRSRRLKERLVRDVLGHLDGDFGEWRPLWPSEQCASFVSGFPLLRPADRGAAHLLDPHVPAAPPDLTPAPGVRSFELGESLVVYEPVRGRLHLLNAAAAALWLGLGEGLPVERLSEELARAGEGYLGADPLPQCWDLLCAWARKGLLASFPIPDRALDRSAEVASAPPIRGTVEGDDVFAAVGDRAGKARHPERSLTPLDAEVRRATRLTIAAEAADGAVRTRLSPEEALVALFDSGPRPRLSSAEAEAWVRWIAALEERWYVPAGAA